MESALLVVLVTVILLIIIAPALFFIRRSTDVSLEDDNIILRYPFSKEEIKISNELKSWNLQEAYYYRLGKIYALNLELKNGKWKTIGSRYNPQSFEKILSYLEAKYSSQRTEPKR